MAKRVNFLGKFTRFSNVKFALQICTLRSHRDLNPGYKSENLVS
jgi:hypothetical protein